MKRRALAEFILILTIFTILLGCQQVKWRWFDIKKKESTNSSQLSAGEKEKAVELLLPAKIDVLPFTKFKSWDTDPAIDGIEVYLRPLDSFGDQTKAIGTFRFELYTFRKAHRDPRGNRIGFWEINLTTKEAQTLHWDKITRTYKFKLGLAENMNITPGKYILDTTFILPWESRLSTEYMLELKKQPKRWLRKPTKPKRKPLFRFKLF